MPARSSSARSTSCARRIQGVRFASRATRPRCPAPGPRVASRSSCRTSCPMRSSMARAMRRSPYPCLVMRQARWRSGSTTRGRPSRPGCGSTCSSHTGGAKARRARTRAASGWGGLFIVREIARAHGGSVEVRSDAQGTTFAVSLPDARPPPVSGDVDRQRETGATGWAIHGWIQQAINLFFGLAQGQVYAAGDLRFFDKIPPKRPGGDFRVVPPGVVRYGAHVEKGAIVMPGYVNIGARVGAGSMVDTWATVGSCAQVGRGVHLSGGVGLGGVLEPPGARPVIIEDGAFIGSRCIVVEGVLVEEEAVLGAGVVLTSALRDFGVPV